MAIAEISVEELYGLLKTGGVTLFDVREPHEYEDGHVPSARLIPLGEVLDHLDDFRAADGEVLVICKSGGRSLHAAMALADNGITATNVAGGTIGWIAHGFNVETGDAAEGSDPA